MRLKNPLLSPFGLFNAHIKILIAEKAKKKLTGTILVPISGGISGLSHSLLACNEPLQAAPLYSRLTRVVARLKYVRAAWQTCLLGCAWSIQPNHALRQPATARSKVTGGTAGLIKQACRLTVGVVRLTMGLVRLHWAGLGCREVVK